METLIDTQTGEILDPMTESEAREKTAQIRDNLKDCRLLAWSIYEREGWKALGYTSITDWAVEALEVNPSWLSRNLTACEIERQLQWPLGSKKEGQLRPFTPLLATPERLQAAAAKLPNPDDFTGQEADSVVDEIVAEMNEIAALEWYHSMDALLSEMEGWQEKQAWDIIDEIDRAKGDYRATYANELDGKYRQKLAAVANVDNSDLESAWGDQHQANGKETIGANVYIDGNGTIEIKLWRNKDNGDSEPNKAITGWATGNPAMDKRIMHGMKKAAEVMGAKWPEDKSE